MSTPTPGALCNWDVDTTCCPDWDTYAASVQETAVAWATEILDALSGRQFARCEVTVRPCGPRCHGFGGYMTFPVGYPGSTGAGTPWMTPWIDNGVWRNCGCTGGCTCEASEQVLLPTPVVSITEVMIDGLVLADTAYRIDNGRILVRTDGGSWPDCQDMDLANDEVGAFAVTYLPGRALPRAGEIAVGELACQFAKACVGSDDCVLPQQLASLSRNGVEVSIVDPATFLENGLTGVANVDLWIRSVNPRVKGQRSRVLSGDIRRGRFVT